MEDLYLTKLWILLLDICCHPIYFWWAFVVKPCVSSVVLKYCQTDELIFCCALLLSCMKRTKTNTKQNKKPTREVEENPPPPPKTAKSRTYTRARVHTHTLTLTRTHVGTHAHTHAKQKENVPSVMITVVIRSCRQVYTKIQ